MSKQTDKIREAYDRRDKNRILNAWQQSDHPYHTFLKTLKIQSTSDALKIINRPPDELRVLDIGCGYGASLGMFADMGVKNNNLFGIDLLDSRVEGAKAKYPLINFQQGNVEHLPYESDSFDIVSQSTVFTSILDDKMKSNVAKEMIRVLRPGGHILWTDFMYSNPSNKDVKGVSKKEIYRLFQPECNIFFLKKYILLPPISKRLSKYSLAMCFFLGKIPFLCGHYFGLFKKL